MVLLPCCYHKLSLAGGDGKWNPLSHTVKDVLCKADCALNICALRLAAQDSRQRLCGPTHTHTLRVQFCLTGLFGMRATGGRQGTLLFDAGTWYFVAFWNVWQ